MANFITILTFKRLNAIKINNIKKITSKIQRTASSIGFIEQAIFNKFTPTFAKIKGQFLSENDRIVSEEHLLTSYLKDHVKNLNKLCCQQNDKIRPLAIFTLCSVCQQKKLNMKCISVRDLWIKALPHIDENIFSANKM